MKSDFEQHSMYNIDPDEKENSKMPTAIETSSVVEFYNNGIVFLTGATGFLGKALIEKLLRVCRNIHIYVLVRVKKGKDPQTRLKELFEDPIFTSLRSENPDVEKKVTCIPGDVSCLRLGLSDSDYDFLTREVTHVIHSAATVRFNEHIKTAISINVLGTREITTLCNKCARLKVFVHISTAFSNCVPSQVNEEFYDPPLTPDRAINLIEILNEDALQTLTPELIKPWPNTYTYTKVIAESLIKERAKSFPSLIVRPAIVMGAYREPTEGWVDNIYGPTGIIVGVGIGLMRVFYADKESEANVVPVDLTVNCILCSAWKVGTTFNSNTVMEKPLNDSNANIELSKKPETTPKIYNFVADRKNILNWGEILVKTYEMGSDLPTTKAIWYYTITLTKIRLFYWSLTLILHYVPGVLTDAVLLLLGKKPQMIKIYNKIHVFAKSTGVFALKTWDFTDHNTKKLWSELSDKDKDIFYFDMKALNWNHYLRNVLIGIRKFLLKDPDHTLPAARRKLFFLWLGHRLLQFSFLALCIWILNKCFFRFDIFQTYFKDPVLIQTANST